MRKVNIVRLLGGACLAGLSSVVLSGPVVAQDAPGTIPGLGNFSLPVAQPTPTPTPTPGPPPLVPPVSVTPSVTPRPAPTPTPTPTPRTSPSTPAITLPTLRPVATPTPRPPVARPAPTATPTPAAVATPEPVETPLTTPSPTPLPTETPVATTAPPAESGLPIWLIPAALVGLAILIGGVIFLRRRRVEEPWEEPVAYAAPEPEPQPAPEPLPPVAPQPAAPADGPAPRFLTPPPPPPPPPAPVVLPSSLTIEAPSVRRAGINLITATADVSVVLRNDGAEPLRNIRVEIRLTSAQPGQDAALAALFAGPIERLFTPAFDLAPGEEKTVRTLSTMARDAITVLQAGDRPMFVPVVAVRAIAIGPDGEGQAMAAFALGVERAGSDKLGPFWLDQPPRMYDNIGVRPHAVRV